MVNCPSFRVTYVVMVWLFYQNVAGQRGWHTQLAMLSSNVGWATPADEWAHGQASVLGRSTWKNGWWCWCWKRSNCGEETCVFYFVTGNLDCCLHRCQEIARLAALNISMLSDTRHVRASDIEKESFREDILKTRERLLNVSAATFSNANTARHPYYRWFVYAYNNAVRSSRSNDGNTSRSATQLCDKFRADEENAGFEGYELWQRCHQTGYFNGYLFGISMLSDDLIRVT